MCWAYRYSLLRHKRKQVTLRSNDLIQKITEFLEWGLNLADYNPVKDGAKISIEDLNGTKEYVNHRS